MNIPTELGTEKVGVLLRRYAIPAIIAMTASSLYNIVDSIFIGQGVGALAISALAVCFPFQNLAAAFGSMVGVGASTLISVKLGQKDYKVAQLVLGNVVILNILIGLAFTFISLIFLKPILFFFGASDQTIGDAMAYMEIILYGNVITHLYLGLNSVLRSAGYPSKSMYMTMLAVVLNCILDPIFIFGFGWGIKGAAWATVLAQIVSLIWQVRLFSNKQELIHFQKGIFTLKKRIVSDTFAIGLSPFLMNVASCFIVILINNSLKKHGGDYAIGAYGIVNRVMFLFAMFVMGINQGMQPIAGYNYGARQISRLLEVLKKACIFATLITTSGFLFAELTPGLVTRIFTHDAELIELAKYGLRISFLAFPIIGYQMVVSNFFQSIGMAKKAIFLSLTRQVLFLIPFLIIFPNLFGITGVWASMPSADLISAITSAVMITRQISIWKKAGIMPQKQTTT